MTPNLKILFIATLLCIGSLVSCIPPAHEKPQDPRTFDPSDMDMLEMGYSLPYIKDFLYSLERTNLLYLMEDTGPYTVFAPVQQSFLNFRNKHGIDHLDQFSESELAEIMLYHFIPQKWSLEMIPEGYHPTLLPEKTTGNAVDLYIDKKSIIVLNGINYIDEPDMMAVNGYIHSLKSVLEIPALIDQLSFNSDFSLFMELLHRKDLDPEIINLLTDEDPITLLVPTDTAIEAFLLGHPAWDTISDIPTVDLNEIIYNHLVDQGNVVLSSILQDLTLSNMRGKEIKVHIDYPIWTVMEGNRRIARILTKDIQAVNGIIHEIDQVLLP